MMTLEVWFWTWNRRIPHTRKQYKGGRSKNPIKIPYLEGPVPEPRNSGTGRVSLNCHYYTNNDFTFEIFAIKYQYCKNRAVTLTILTEEWQNIFVSNDVILAKCKPLNFVGIFHANIVNIVQNIANTTNIGEVVFRSILASALHTTFRE